MTDPGSAQEPADDRDEDEADEDLDLDDDAGEDEEEEPDEEPEEREMPSLGDTVDGRVLVCHGDDQPEYYVGWLEWAVERFQRLADLSSEHELPVEDSGVDFDRGVMDLLTDAGIDFDSSHWEGSCTSGIYQMGWVDAKKVDAVAQAIDDLLDAAEKEMRDRLLDRLRTGFEEAVSDADFDELLEFKATNALELKAEVARLRQENLRLKLELSESRKQAARRTSTRSRPKKPPDQGS